ncbi:MAG: HAMP domain-containing histidine kinase, partial [Phycisphaerales bacterium]|nr:HAMP domain-containing histidine kinase [Phycisphaerales bacterium]
AHEMNNPLAVISGRAQLLALRLGDTADGASAKAIVGATRDLTELITSLHLLADPPEPNLRPCTVGEVADRALEVARDRLDRDVPLAINAQDAVRQLVADPDLLGPALAEFICNAAESAAPDQDRPTISLRAQTDPLDGRLVLSVIDTGPGLSPRALRHAFDPFFSEKPAGRQRGLGLPRARRLVQQMGGQITIEPASPVGTEARITLASPACHARAA